jgi:hypothetical protein
LRTYTCGYEISVSELVTPPEAVAKLGVLERPQRLAASDGGGVVFPKGFYGAGVYLPEWEYLRYCARADHQEPDPESLIWWQRNVLRPTRLGTFFQFVAIWTVGIYASIQFDTEAIELGLFCIIGGVLCWRLWQAWSGVGKRFSETFASAVRVPFYAYWRARSALVLPHITKSAYLSGFWAIVAVFCLAFLMFGFSLKNDLNTIAAMVVVPLLALVGLYEPFVLIGITLTRFRLGRSPSPADFAPVDPPQRGGA